MYGNWRVALKEFPASRAKTTSGIYMYLDMCGESIVKGEKSVAENGNGRWDYTFDNPYH